jgi:hypothetical protein
MGVEPVVLTEQEIETLKSLARAMDQPPVLLKPPVLSETLVDTETRMREIAREEIASLAALVVGRSQGDASLPQIFGEALADFSGHTGSGDEPG